MNKRVFVGLVIILSACGPGAPGTTTIGVTTPIVGTASVSTVEPIIITELPPDYTPPPTAALPTQTPIPTLPDGLGPTELKYRILDQFPDFFFCDPDYYPVAHGDELDLARQRFPELQANSEEFSAILAHNNLAGLSNFTDEQILLIYREHKKLAAIPFELTDNNYQFQLQVAESEGQGELITGLIDGQGSITVLQRNPSIATCPICLAAGTLIDTPTGPIPIQDLRVGTPVWTWDQAGRRVALPLIQIGKTVVPATHQVVHLVLDDGRELWASPGHPIIDGRTLGKLQIGDSLQGAIIISTERIPYADSFTYDLLPAGETGFYWANGILIASTLIEDHK
jgi:hypothetical protein